MWLTLLLPAILSSMSAGIEYGQSGYVEYHKGEIGVVIVAPHGGEMRPSSIPDRRWGTVEPDDHTRHLALLVAESVKETTGRAPHLIISNLHRKKLDPNREVVEAAQGNPEAMQAWLDYHNFIEEAKELQGVGVVIDLHGQSHGKNSTEMGYLLSTKTLNSGDYNLARSSVASLGEILGASGEEIIIGKNSIGDFLEAEGYKAFPSSRQHSPGDWAYFPGGYTVIRHSNGSFDSISVETARPVRGGSRWGGDEPRVKFGKALGKAIANFYTTNYKEAYKRIKYGLIGTGPLDKESQWVQRGK